MSFKKFIFGLKEKIVSYPLLFVLIVTVLLSFSYRWVFLEQFDYEYMRDFYYNSQWRVPGSTRVMGDNDLFAYVGYELVQGASPFDANPETPPLGKYLYGLSIKLFNNASIVTPFIYFLIAVVFYQLSKVFLATKSSRALALYLLVLSPILILQFPTKLLDLPQLLALLSHVLFFLWFIKSKTTVAECIYMFISAMSLGAFIAIKVGAFFIAIIVADIYLLFKRKNVVWSVPIILISAIIFLAIYFQYFLNGESLYSWIRAQKWVYNFYVKSGTQATPHLFFTTIFFGLYKGWWGNARWHILQDWSIVWPLGFVSLVWLAVKRVRLFFVKKELIGYMLILSFGFVFTYLLIPFWSRYLNLLLPFMIIALVLYLDKLKSKVAMSTVVILIVVQAVISVLPQSEGLTTLSAQYWGHGHYQDLYSVLDSAFKQTQSRQKFSKILADFDQEHGIISRQVKIEFPFEERLKSQAVGRLFVNYKDDLGEDSYTAAIAFVKEYNQWKIKWDWGYVKARDEEGGVRIDE